MKPISPIPYPKPCCSTSYTPSSANLSRFSKFCPQQSPALLARKALLKKVQKREMQKLRSVLPKSSILKFRKQSSSASQTRKVLRRKADDDLAVVLGAVHYIGQLHAAILTRIQAGTLPPVESLRRTYRSGKTQSLSYRKQCLQSLINLLNDNCDEICGAIYKDLRKCKTEAYCYENYFVLNEAKDAIRYLKDWASPKHVSRNLLQALDSAYVSKQPLGVVLVIGPWNYPIQLLLCPLVGAIAAGNCVILKPSEYAPATAALIAKLIDQYFDADIVTVVTGGVEETTELLKERFDHIFFTGSPSVGKQIMQAATQYLTPVTLELGGKCPVIVDKESDIPLTAKRIAWGKLIACGQTCLAPDYIYCHESVKNELIEELKKSIGKAYGNNPQSSNDYCRIVNERHFERLSKLIFHSGRIVYGGHLDRSDLYVSPTILDDVSTNDLAMREEIFGPVLPILSYVNVEEAIEYINDNEKPLALYVFSTNRSFVKDVLSRTSSGGVSVNDVIMHLALETLPFGGVGHSGMGRYHGKYSFDCFTHERSVLYRPQCGEKVIWMRYPPYDSTKFVWAKRVLSRRQLIPLPILYFVPLCIFGFFMAFLLKKYF